MRSFEWIRIRICDQDHTDHGALKELSFRRALGEFQKVRYYKTCVCTWVTELFPEWLVLLHGLLARTISLINTIR